MPEGSKDCFHQLLVREAVGRPRAPQCSKHVEIPASKIEAALPELAVAHAVEAAGELVPHNLGNRVA